MSLKYVAHFAWDLSLGQIRTSKKGGAIKETFKISSRKLWDFCLSSGFMYVSVCVFGFLKNIAEVVNKF